MRLIFPRDKNKRHDKKTTDKYLLMNRLIKILNKYWQTKPNNTIKNLYVTNCALFQECKVGLTAENQCTILH